MPQLINNTPTNKSKSVYSAPVSKEAKQLLMNESARTGLSQKELIDRAVTALLAGSRIPSAMPIQL